MTSVSKLLTGLDAEGKALLDDLAGYGAPVVPFSGGEPLVREDLGDSSPTRLKRAFGPSSGLTGCITEARARTGVLLPYP